MDAAMDAAMVADALKEKVDDALPAQRSSSNHHHDNWELS
jgi:hypothetical protein